MFNADDLKKEFLADIESAASEIQLSDVWKKYLSKTGSVQKLMTGIKEVAKEEKKAYGQFVNEGMDAFVWEELGLWAQDPEEGEILYAVGNARGNGDTIEGWTEKGREFVFGMELVFSGTANVTAEISRTLILPR